MEIISYVGAASASTGSGYSTGFKFNLPKPKTHRQKSMIFVLDGYTSPFERALKRVKRYSVVFYKKLFLYSVSCVLVCSCVFTAMSYFESHAGPAKLMAMPDNELLVLNDAMSSFAMTEYKDDFDENGNVLSDDGSVLTMNTSGLGQVVTYSNYVVKNGDTISSITKRHGLTNISTLIAVNNIDNVRTLRAGQRLVVPSQDGLIHTVGDGESLNMLAMKYHVSLEEILDANDIESQSLLSGQKIFIPGAKMDNEQLKKAMGELFIYPISGKWRLSSPFGRRNDPITGVVSSHTGIDMAAPPGTPITAAMSGKVVYVGWSNIFGNYAIINHGNGYQSLYGHMQKTLCHTNQIVGQGTRIGLVGSTGYSTGPHLHFTVYKNSKLVDPLSLIK